MEFRGAYHTLSFNKVAGLRAVTLLQEDSRTPTNSSL